MPCYCCGGVGLCEALNCCRYCVLIRSALVVVLLAGACGGAAAWVGDRPLSLRPIIRGARPGPSASPDDPWRTTRPVIGWRPNHRRDAPVVCFGQVAPVPLLSPIDEIMLVRRLIFAALAGSVIGCVRCFVQTMSRGDAALLPTRGGARPRRRDNHLVFLLSLAHSRRRRAPSVRGRGSWCRAPPPLAAARDRDAATTASSSSSLSRALDRDRAASVRGGGAAGTSAASRTGRRTCARSRSSRSARPRSRSARCTGSRAATRRASRRTSPRASDSSAAGSSRSRYRSPRPAVVCGLRSPGALDPPGSRLLPLAAVGVSWGVVGAQLCAQGHESKKS